MAVSLVPKKGSVLVEAEDVTRSNGSSTATLASVEEFTLGRTQPSCSLAVTLVLKGITTSFESKDTARQNCLTVTIVSSNNNGFVIASFSDSSQWRFIF